MKNSLYLFIAWLFLFSTGCFIFRQYSENQLYINPLCGHLENVIGYKFGSDQWDNVNNGGSCFVKFPIGVMTIWNVGDCNDYSEPITYQITDYTCH
jgi:hypothetical protein